MVLDWIVSYWINNYEWLIPVKALIITILIFSYTQWQRKKVESAQLSFNLTQRLYEPKIEQIRVTLANAITKKATITFKIQDISELNVVSMSEDKIDDYLNELEQIGLFVNKGVLGKEFAYQMFGYQFVSVWEFEPIKEYIKKCRTTYQKDLWNQFEKAYKKFKKIHSRRKVIPAIRLFKEDLDQRKQTKLDE